MQNIRKFCDLDYIRPDYAGEKEKLRQFKDKMSKAASYEELRDLWLSMRARVQYVDYMEEVAFIRYLCGISYDFNKTEVGVQDIEYPAVAALQGECDGVLLRSSYLENFRAEFGDMIVSQLKTKALSGNEDTLQMQSEEAALKTEFTGLISCGKPAEAITEQRNQIFERLIVLRTEIAKTLGYHNYIEMAYRLHRRYDYGTKEIVSFRKQILELVTPACRELHKTATYRYPDAIITSADELMAGIRDMYHDLSKESGDYIDFIIENGFYNLESRPNKRSNYFGCCMVPCLKVPFSVGNFSGGGMEAIYFIHELAHGFAFYTAAHKQKLYDYHRAATSVNEIHSKTMEHFAYPYLERFVGNQKRAFIHNHLYHQFDNLPYRCAIDEFEHAVYEDLSLSRVQRCELWAEIERKYMPWIDQDRREEIQNGSFLPNQNHLFTHPFYYIEYDIAQISVFEFYKRSKENFGQAWRDYYALCGTGGSLGYLDLLNVGKLTSPFSDGAVKRICTPALEELFETR